MMQQPQPGMAPMQQSQPAQPPGAGQPMQQAINGQMVMQMAAQVLTPAEFQELDSYITPRFFELATKLAPELAPLLEPFIQMDAMTEQAEMAEGQMGNMDPMAGAGDEAMEHGGGYPATDAGPTQGNPFASVYAER